MSEVRDRILEAAIECVEQEGIQDVTTRSIAKQAGVNSAAINYYFRTKEALLDEVLTRTAEHFLMDIEETLKKTDRPFKENLREFCTYLLEGGLRWPRISKAHLYETFTHDRYDGVFVAKLNRVLGRLLASMRENLPRRSEEKLKLGVVRFACSILFPILVPDLFRDLVGVGFGDQNLRTSYIQELIEDPWFAPEKK